MDCENCAKNNEAESKFSDFKIAIPLAIVFIAIFGLLQKLGLINFINAGKVSYGTAFLIGLIASASGVFPLCFR